MQPAVAPPANGALTALAVLGGGALGAVLRHGLSVALPVDPVGVGTIVANMTGALALGVLVARAQGPLAAAFWRTGVLGAYTTFSAVMVQTVDLPTLAAAAYLAVQVGCGIAAAALGLQLGAAAGGRA